MTQTPTRFERYESDYHAFETRLAVNGPSWLRDLRSQALERFHAMGFPTARRGNEPWKYTNVSPIARNDFAYPLAPAQQTARASDVKQAAPWHRAWVNVVFVNGHFSEKLSSIPDDVEGVRVESLARAMHSDGEVIQKHLSRYASVEKDAFAALNTAFLWDGAFVHVAESSEVETPINVVFVSTRSDEPIITHPRLLVVAGRYSQATLIESYVGLDDNRYFTNAVGEVVLEQGATLDHYRILRESTDSFHIGMLRVHQEELSVFNSSVFQRSMGLGRYDLYNRLDGDGSESYQHGLYTTAGSQHMDNYINIDHVQPNGTSRLYYKGILTEKSRAVFGGTVWVQPHAIKTNSKQEDKNLVLSPDAEVDSKPALYIYADDVQCGHGASAGNIDVDTVFYMRSRGLDLEEASRLLIYGFASEIIEQVEVDELRHYLERLFLDSLPSYTFEFS